MISPASGTATREMYKPIPIREGHPMRIPERTMTRNRPTRTAAMLYIYGDPETERVDLPLAEISRMTGINEITVRKIAKEDRWEEFRLDLISEIMEESDLSGPLQLKRSSEELGRIKREVKRQIEEIPVLQTEAGRVLDTMKTYPPESKPYASMVATLDKLTKMLERRSGKENFDKQHDEIRKAQIRIEEKKAENKKGENADSKIIDITPR